MRWLFLFVMLQTGLFSFAQVNRNDVIIDEIMTDPSPVIGLPEAEFAELKNTSARPVNLNGWKFSDATGTATISQNFILQPDSFVIICSTGSRALFAAFGNALAVTGFPSLDNTSELLSLRSTDGKLIHALQYNKSWYRNDVKSEGGWTLEMIDTRNACSSAANWKASVSDKGGTPGRKNSVDAVNTDVTSPTLLRSYAADSATISLFFDEPLDSFGAVAVQKYFVSDGVGIPQKAVVMPPLFSQVLIYTNNTLQRNKIYSVTIRQISDCSGNATLGTNTVKTGLAVTADTFDVVINELLFNPKPGGVDYLEIYNRSNKIINVKDLYIANRSATNAISNLRQVSTENRLIFPDEYLVITEDALLVQRQYTVKNQLAFAEVSTMPSYPDEKGTVILLNSAGKVIDELSYDEKWHFRLIDNNEGVALERIDYSKPTQNAGNWHSASTSAGYGTPTYQNSQFKADVQAEGSVTVIPAVFSPDNDGFNDFTTIYYKFPEPGYVCNITLFNAQGIPVRTLTQNALCGITGYFRWDGLDERGHRLNMGIYVVLIEVFNLNGNTKRFKKAVALAGKLK